MDIMNKINEINKELTFLYSEAECSLDFGTPFQLLVSTQLAAQCTDARVNQVTPKLFELFPDAKAFAALTTQELEVYIRSTGFFRNKAKHIIECSKMLVEKYDGIVPNNMEQLLELQGVGRKTANLILGVIYRQPAVVIDTHAGRLSRRMGLTKNMNPDKVEDDLRKLLDPKTSNLFCHRLVMHGRAVCTARKPKCNECTLFDLCDRLYL